MKRQKFSKRFISPVLIIFFVMALSFIIYNLAWRLESDAIHRPIAFISGITLFLSVALGTLFVYPMAYFRGASLIERIIASLINPLIWSTKEVIRVTASYTVMESLYFYLNPLIIAVIFAAISEMGLSEIICRKRGGAAKPFAVPAVLSLLVGLFVVVFLFAWGQGEHSFYIFLEGFRRLFGPGIGV